MEMVEILKALGDETRMRIINLIKGEPLCVCEIQEILGVSQSNTSRHLIKLKNAKLIQGEKQAQWVYYGLNEVTFQKHGFLSEILKDFDQCAEMQKDLEKLNELVEKGITCNDLILKANQ